MAAFSGYATLADVYALGLRAEAFTAQPRRVSSADPASGTLTLRGHGLAVGAALSLIVLSSSIPGEAAAALPGGLSTSTAYEAVPVTSDTFKVRPVDGATISSFFSAGVGVFAIVVDPEPQILRAIEAAAGWMHAHMPAHSTPVPLSDSGGYPPILVQLNARFAARDALVTLGLQNPAYSDAAKAIQDRYGVDQALLIDWKKGMPIPGLVDATVSTAEMGAALVAISSNGGFDLPDGRV